MSVNVNYLGTVRDKHSQLWKGFGLTAEPGRRDKVLIINTQPSPAGAHADRITQILRRDFDVEYSQDISGSFSHLHELSPDGVMIVGHGRLQEDDVGAVLYPYLVSCSISDGITVMDRDLRIVWINEQLQRWGWNLDNLKGVHCFQAYNHRMEICENCPAKSAMETKEATNVIQQGADGRFYEVLATPVMDQGGNVTHVIEQTRDVTKREVAQRQIKIIREAGSELLNLNLKKFGGMSIQERSEFLRERIIGYVRETMSFDHFIIYRSAGEILDPIVSHGFKDEIGNWQRPIVEEGQGIVSHVAFSRKPYICPDVSQDRLYISAQEGVNSSITVPITFHGEPFGVFHVESFFKNAFSDSDIQFLTILGNYVAVAINTLEIITRQERSTIDKMAVTLSHELNNPLEAMINEVYLIQQEIEHMPPAIRNKLRNIDENIDRIKSSFRQFFSQQGLEITEDAEHALYEIAHDLAGTRILVIDDEEKIRMALKEVLSRNGAQVELAASGEEGLEIARHQKFDVILSDIKMPGISGYDLFERIRELRPEQPVVLMTGFGYDPSHALVKASRAGMKAALFKPFKVSLLKQKLKEAMDGK